ncbi:polymorphic toxin type 44 domain-containing protein [Priestia megaterium]|uniref:polymorphic toxin type 44 domain-containing protein n=1 Tax=Priestia megaterium TaxID=1404 RepID=UPI0006814940|nr:polymorphic toxin type 44 domain-containing protein [Priestia megaterium]
MLSPEEITEVAHNSYKNAETSQKFSTFSVDTGLKSLNLKGLVESNRNELEKFNASVLKTSPGSAYNATVGYFVEKVQEGGPWDYKVRSGYKPWYKEFNASTYNGKKVINSEYIGNYNYAYTGELLFSKKTLLIGGGAVGVVVGQPEDSKYKDVITKGYNDAVKYW